MKLRRIAQLSVAIIAWLTLCLTSCSTNSVYGKYVYNQNPSDYTELKMAEGKKDCDASYPLNRGDILILVMLINRELPVASSDWADPFNGKRLTAMREKLGNFAIDAPQMSSAEAQQFRG
jgi:hypothetical protein